MHVSLSSQIKEGGNYYENCTETEPAKAAILPDDISQLWDLSCRQTRINEFGKN